MNLRYKIKNWIEDTFWYNPKYGIPNLISWFKTIYKDRDWDYVYTLEILIKKLDKQAKWLIKNDILENSQEISEQIFYASNLLKKIVADNYVEDAMVAHREKWGDYTIIWIPCEDPNLTEMKQVFDRPMTDEEREQEREEFCALINKADSEKEEDLKKVFAFIAEHIEGWWD